MPRRSALTNQAQRGLRTSGVQSPQRAQAHLVGILDKGAQAPERGAQVMNHESLRALLSNAVPYEPNSIHSVISRGSLGKPHVNCLLSALVPVDILVVPKISMLRQAMSPGATDNVLSVQCIFYRSNPCYIPSLGLCRSMLSIYQDRFGTALRYTSPIDDRHLVRNWGSLIVFTVGFCGAMLPNATADGKPEWEGWALHRLYFSVFLYRCSRMNLRILHLANHLACSLIYPVPCSLRPLATRIPAELVTERSPLLGVLGTIKPSIEMFTPFIVALALSAGVLGAPAPAADAKTSSTTKHASTSTTSSVSTAVPSSTVDSSLPVPTLPYASDDLNESYLDKFQNELPEPIRGTKGAKLLGPQNVALDRQNPDFLASPGTDNGAVGHSACPTTVFRMVVGRVIHAMPIATTMAGVNMRLKAGGIRELHWHITAEWAYVLAGSCRVSVTNADGQNYDYPGDLWYFPAGIPHVLQGLNDVADGCDLIDHAQVFDDGEFSEDSTFSVTDWMAHVPKEVLSKNFKVNASAFDHIPDRQLWMLPSAVPTGSAADKAVKSPQGVSTLPYTFAASKANSTKVQGGTVKVVDSRTFEISKTIAMAEVSVEVGGIRELHANARTFNYQAGDIGYVPPSFGHYVENIGNTTLKFLEIFNADKYEDISLNQWLALTPPDLVKVRSFSLFTHSVKLTTTSRRLTCNSAMTPLASYRRSSLLLSAWLQQNNALMGIATLMGRTSSETSAGGKSGTERANENWGTETMTRGLGGHPRRQEWRVMGGPRKRLYN
ncbi:putative oxalate decarboxylase [Rhizoctonia solani AG-1 IA]|uniref:Putative oxalate decarboxylase n=1 Tax=Thanatephorus cucumeris (strain AG1-IA) TaxID=983506 RepID=L8WFY0_THACA|nr:putative oxalate decarboxylase [Rhizoctonia solani AG-1 IA]